METKFGAYYQNGGNKIYFEPSPIGFFDDFTSFGTLALDIAERLFKEKR